METRKSPRFKIVPQIKRTSVLRRQKYYFSIESNVNGKTLLISEKYSNREDREEIMNALKEELSEAKLVPEIDMDHPELPLKYRKEK